MAFNPNEMTLEEGLKLVRDLQSELALDPKRIFTSKAEVGRQLWI